MKKTAKKAPAAKAKRAPARKSSKKVPAAKAPRKPAAKKPAAPRKTATRKAPTKAPASDKMDAKKSVFLKKLRATGGHITKSAQAAKVARGTYYNWRREDEDFGRICDDIFAGSVDEVEYALFQNAKAGNVTAQIFYLKCRGGWKEPAAELKLGKLERLSDEELYGAIIDRFTSLGMSKQEAERLVRES